MFGGDQVKGAYNSTAIIQELATSPSSLEASMILDSNSLLPGHVGRLDGGAQAYTQAFVRALAKGKSFAEATADARAVALAQLRDSQAAPLAAPVASQSDTQTDDPTRR